MTPASPIATLRDTLSRSISAKLLALTILLILLAEAVVLVPSIAKHRMDYLTARVEAAYLVTLALEAPDAEMLDDDTARRLFGTANIEGVTVMREGARYLVYAPAIDETQRQAVAHIDLNDENWFSAVGGAWLSFFSSGDALLRVTGSPQAEQDEEVDILVSQKALRQALATYSRNVFVLSLIISTLTASFIYWAFARIIVDPVKKLTHEMALFESNPEDSLPFAALSGRRDEIGEAEQGLVALVRRIQSLLKERKRLAALGAGISKISHDLRNILASAQLMSDRLAKSDDPRVKKLSPRLISALDRAIALSNDTLSYGRMEPSVLNKSETALHDLVAEVFDSSAMQHVELVNDLPRSLTADVDRHHLFRALFNLIRNATEALAPPPPDAEPDGVERRITAAARENGDAVIIEIADNGPGLPETAREHLFEPFKGSRKPGGSGLGMAIAHEILRAHGGDLALAKSDENGATFRLSLPATAAAIRSVAAQ
ncbi:MAG: HAMP domain-containing sensor histidine kinase [Pseudomonadota bacterium]